jgi:hypothetical protein
MVERERGRAERERVGEKYESEYAQELNERSRRQLDQDFRVIEGLKVGLKAAEGYMDEWTRTDCATETGKETGAETDRGPEAETGAEKGP